MQNTILSISYLPTVEYIAFCNQGNVLIENCENYTKQSYRNRTCILTANGVQSLIIPVVFDSSQRLIKDTRIDYKTPWQRNHWRAIETAYNNSPFFLYYKDYLFPFFKNKYQFLFDFDLELLITLMKLMQIPFTPHYTDEYRNDYPESCDLRNVIHPKNQQKSFNIAPYAQVFESKFGFIPHLSIIDLLFNEGSDSRCKLSNFSKHI